MVTWMYFVNSPLSGITITHGDYKKFKKKKSKPKLDYRRINKKHLNLFDY